MSQDSIFLPTILDGEDKSSPFLNCIRKNYKHIRKWAKRTETDCFRIYDRQLHHYPLAIDFYAGRFCVHYFSPTKEDEDPPAHLIEEVSKGLTLLFGDLKFGIYWRTRFKKKETRQYEKAGEQGEFFTVYE